MAWALWSDIVVHIDAINLKFVRASMIKFIGKLRHCFADIRIGTPFLVKARYASWSFWRYCQKVQASVSFGDLSLHRQPHRYCFSLQMRRTIIRVNIKATDGQPIMKSQFRHFSVSKLLRQYGSENQPRIEICWACWRQWRLKLAQLLYDSCSTVECDYV